ncbi:UbiA family prenyltransferase [Catenovulum agarivorans]|uniref:UbiA family prenyltransferase n=1 Tax=Catenovulum agarivorans TaxID=1172192 RepID=UPI0004B5F979|nr:UbiA family prenyltransferase [Catenovulum agarivorans]
MKAYLQLIRAPNGITAVTNIVAAAAIVSGGQLTWQLLYLVVASMCFYYAGMALNDCLDFAEDAQERPFRPLPSGQISLVRAQKIVSVLFCIALVACYLFNPNNLTSLVLGVCLTLSIVLYNAVFKQGLLGAFTMGSCRLFNWLLGASFVTVTTEQFDLIFALLVASPIFFYITAVTFLSKQETHASNKDTLIMVELLLGLAYLPLVYLHWSVFQLTGWPSLLSWILLTVAALFLLQRFVLLTTNFTPKQIQLTIKWMIIAVIPFDAMLVAMAGHYSIALMLLVLLFPCRMLAQKLYMT